MLHSQEGVVQGDPLSMYAYAVATVPLIRELENRPNYIHAWYADDYTAIGNISDIRGWFEHLVKIGPCYGYFPEPNKSCLVVKEPMIPQALSRA